MSAPARPPLPNLPLLIVVATEGEAARLGDLSTPHRPEQAAPAEVVVSGVGPVAAALSTASALARARYGLVVSAGIAGAYPGSGLRPGDLAVSSHMIQADLGAQDGADWLDLNALDLSVEPAAEHRGDFVAWDGAAALAERLGAAYGPMLTRCTVTGSHEEAQRWARLFPVALTEGMEGAGVAHAALRAGVPALEVRGVSNAVGPRDRASWRLSEALAATRRGLEGLLTVLES